MEITCSHCHADIQLEVVPDWCPACGGALLEREYAAAAEIDHRGILLPRRHALGGIITPQ